MNNYFFYAHSRVSPVFAAKSSRIRFSAIKVESLVFVFGAILLALCIFYIVLSNMVAASGFKLRDQRRHIEELNLQNKKFETELANRESIARLEEEARRIGLVPIGRVKYIDSPVSSVAVR